MYPFATSSPVIDWASRSGISPVVNQMLPGLISRSFTEAAVLPTSGNLCRSMTPAMAICAGVP